MIRKKKGVATAYAEMVEEYKDELGKSYAETVDALTAAAEVLGTKRGAKYLSYLLKRIDGIITSPSITNPNETLWMVEGQRQLSRVIQRDIQVGLAIKAHGAEAVLGPSPEARRDDFEP